MMHDQRPTILVVDDEITIRRMMSRLLERAGYRVYTAGSGDLWSEGVDRLVARTGLPPVCKPFTAADLLGAVGAICKAAS